MKQLPHNFIIWRPCDQDPSDERQAVEQLDLFRKKHSKELGFYPIQGIADSARIGQVLIAACNYGYGPTTAWDPYVGFIRWSHRDDHATILMIGVQPHLRRRGIATALINAVKRTHPKDKELTLRCRADMTPANSLW